MIGPREWILIILAVILLIYGPKKIPQIAESIGKAIKSFREGQEDTEEETKEKKSEEKEEKS